MSFQQICSTYRQNIQQTREQDDATAELSLHIHLKNFLEQTAELLGDAITITHEPRQLEIGRPAQHRFEGEGEAVISTVRYADGHIWINADQHFTDVAPEVWEYEIGAYQVCKKWLQDRKNAPLSHAEVRQYCAILVAIAETLRIMTEIDAALDFQ